MAITFINSANGGTGSATTFSITLPATQADDIIILEYTHRGTADATLGGTYSGPAFTEKHDQQYATSTFSGKTLWSRATGNHSGQTVTGSGLTNSCAAIITVYRGCLTSGDPLADATIVGEQNASGNETQAQITTATNGAWVVLVVANSPDVALSAQTCTSPGTLTERVEVLSTAGTDTSISHASAEKATAGATGAFTWAQTDGASGSWAYAIKPQLTGASWIAALDTTTNIDVSAANVQKRLRVSIENTGGAAGGTSFKWQYRKNGGTWTDITASSSNVKTFASSQFADGDDVPQLLTGGTYQTDNNAAEESTGTFTLTAGIAAGSIFETEITLEFIKADVANADTLDFRIVTSAGVALDTYDVTPQVTIVEGAAATEAVGTITASAALAGDAQAIRRASGTVAATVTVSGDAQAIRQTAGTIAAAATATAHGATIIKAAGTITAAASVTAHGAAVLKAAGAVTGQASVVGDAQAIWKTTGTATAAATVTATAKAIRKTIGTVTAAATVTATGQAVGPVATVGTVTSSATVAATSKAIWKTTGTITAVAAVTSHGAAIKKSAGTVTASAALAGDAQAIRKTAGAITAAASVAAIAKAIRKTVGTVAASATVSGNGVDANSGFEEGTGTVAASAAATAAAKAIWKTSGSAVSVSSVQASSKAIHSAVGTSQAQTAVSAVGEAVSLGNIQSAVGTVQAQATVSAEGENIGEEPEVPPIIPPEPPTFAGWQDTYLHNISAFGGMDPMGSGSYGATWWRPTTPVDNSWKDTSLHNISAYGGMDPMGSGSYGATWWVSTNPVDQAWKNTSLHDIAAYGGMDPMGSGSYGATQWTVTN